MDTPVGKVNALGLLMAPLLVTELPLLPAPPPPPPAPHAVRSKMREAVTGKRMGVRLFFIFELFVDCLNNND